jgi:hypothetical protein
MSSADNIDPEIADLMTGFESRMRQAGCVRDRPAARPTTTREPGVPRQNRTAGIDRSCPPERDFEVCTPAHEEQVRGFVSGGEATRRDKEVYELLAKSFDGLTPGEWVPSQRIREELKIEAVHSCASRIRLWSSMQGFDVDSHITKVVAGKQYWAYRICLEKDSERLARERKRDENESAAAFGDSPIITTRTEKRSAGRPVIR